MENTDRNYYDELIRELSEICGILPEYWDIVGEKHVTSADTARAILRAMKVSIGTAAEIVREISERKSRPWKTYLGPVHVLSVNKQPFSIPIYLPVREGDEHLLRISWVMEDEKGRKDGYDLGGGSIHLAEERQIDGVRYIRVDLADTKQRDIGYYTLHAVCRRGDTPGPGDVWDKTSKIIITPDVCYVPSELENGRAWGLSANLYSIRSKRNWGVGDFGDLSRLAEWVADLKGHFVGINPLHAIPNTKPFGVSPYSPISRLYKNFVYLDLENVPEVKESGDAAKVKASSRFNRELGELRSAKFIDYEKTASLKEKILRKAFELFYKKHFLGETSRGRAFREYAEGEGSCLESFAVFMALREYMSKEKNAYAWQEWPEDYQDISGEAVRKFREKNRKEVLFHQYVQWLIHRRLKGISEKTKKLGMIIGLYNDLAIGAIGGGSDAWSFREVLASGADVGAPPDDFSPDGQKWGFPPAVPERLRETGYELFIQTIRKNMRYGGAIRIDHALGMFRLFWIPEGMTPAGGAYVAYPWEDLLRIVALESVRNRSMVIAEDLGTIGANAREALQSFQMLSYRLFYFERNYPDPSFLAPEGYPRVALCAVTTHDLPTIYGYWKGRDIELRRGTGKYPDDALWTKQIEERQRDKRLILAALKAQGIVSVYSPSDLLMPEMTPELCRAIYHYLALTPCKLLLVSLDDVIGTLDQQNMPGTVDSHPNWVQKTPLALEEIVKDRRFIQLAGVLNKYSV